MSRKIPKWIEVISVIDTAILVPVYIFSMISKFKYDLATNILIGSLIVATFVVIAAAVYKLKKS